MVVEAAVVVALYWTVAQVVVVVAAAEGTLYHYDAADVEVAAAAAARSQAAVEEAVAAKTTCCLKDMPAQVYKSGNAASVAIQEKQTMVSATTVYKLYQVAARQTRYGVSISDKKTRQTERTNKHAVADYSSCRYLIHSNNCLHFLRARKSLVSFVSPNDPDEN